ncbi:MAG: PDZ domain-containing protein [Flavobacteriales bacterium]|nr:PDZ domain-containing protein [Flavobacteriales bacterium]
MKNKFLLLISFLSFNYLVQGQQVRYSLSMPRPETHYFEVDMYISGFKGNFLDLSMPVWAPGSYLVREFEKNVDFFEAESNGKKLGVKKADKNTWRIETVSSDIHVHYSVYAYELSVRTSFLDDSHGYINGTSVFMYIEGKKNLSGTLEIKPHPSFKKISTSLEKTGTNTYHFPDYDILADCPIEIGNQFTFHFNAAGVDHEVAMYGDGNYDVEELKKDMAKVVEAATRVFGENPNKYYLFIVHNLTVGSGGLEHLSSTTLQVNRYTYSGSGYKGFLSLVAHEYFHLWNVKRMRADVLGPFNYDQENYTTLLWVQEGFTSYYDELLLVRSGYHDVKDYFRILSGMMNTLETTPGNKVQSAAESSYDAWIKGYRPNENSVNSQISYYSKGQVLGWILDMEIIIRTKGEKRLDDLMSYLYNTYYKKEKRGFSETEFMKAANLIAGSDLSAFFTDYVYGTKTIDYQSYLQHFGLRLVQNDKSGEVWLGAKLSDAGGKIIVKETTRGGSAYESGLNVNDEIIACNGIRMDLSTFNRLIAGGVAGQEFNLVIARDNVMKDLKIKLLPNPFKDHQVAAADQTDVNQEKLLKKWLGK